MDSKKVLSISLAMSGSREVRAPREMRLSGMCNYRIPDAPSWGIGRETEFTLTCRLMDILRTNKNNNQFTFYEVVRVRPHSSVPWLLWYTEGVVVGMSQCQNGSWGYAVMLLQDRGCCWDINERFLEACGRHMNRGDIYDGASVIVAVDPVTGEGMPKGMNGSG